MLPNQKRYLLNGIQISQESSFRYEK